MPGLELLRLALKVSGTQMACGRKGGAENQAGSDKVYLTSDKLPGEKGRNMESVTIQRSRKKIGQSQALAYA